MTEDEMTDIGAKVYRLCLNSAASHGDTDTDLEWIHTGEEVVRHSDYEIALKRILEIEAENRRLKTYELGFKGAEDAAQIAEEENASLKEQIRVRGERMELMWEVMRAHCPWPIEGGPINILFMFSYMKDWFDDNGKVRDD